MNGLLLHLDPQSPELLPRQVARQFRNKILLGDIHDRDSLPPSARLAREHRVSVSTIQQAYRELEREGPIEAREGASPTDVAGKGFGASLIMASVKAMLPFVAAERSVDEMLGLLQRTTVPALEDDCTAVVIEHREAGTRGSGGVR